MTPNDAGILISQLPRNSRVSSFLSQMNDLRSIPFIYREVAYLRKKYSLSYDHDLFPPAAMLKIYEAIPIFINHILGYQL